MTMILRGNCCDPPCPSGVQACDDCDGCTDTLVGNAYMFPCPPSTNVHGFEDNPPHFWVPWDCWDYARTTAVWLYRLHCDVSQVEVITDPDTGGTSTWTNYAAFTDQITEAGRMNWSTSVCAYENNGYVVRWKDKVNGKMFKQNHENDNYSLVEDLTAPTLTFPDGTIRYTIEMMSTYDAWGGENYYFGETIFIDTDDTEFIQTGWVDDPEMGFSIPDWVPPLRDHQIEVHPVQLASGAVASSQWSYNGLWCSYLNTVTHNNE